MPNYTTLNTGHIIDTEGVRVIRAVSDNERDRQNASRAELSPQYKPRNFTVAIEIPGDDGKTKVSYDTDISVADFVATKLGPMRTQFALLPDQSAAVHEAAEVLAIRPLARREDSDKRTVLHLAGASQRGLFTALDMPGLLIFLGKDRTRKLAPIGNEGFINRAAIVGKPTLLDPTKPLAEGQSRHTTAVKIGGRLHYFDASPAEILGVYVIDARPRVDADSGEGRPAGHARARGSAARPAPKHD